jgi:ribulose-5-phosphate 4-epimerase/fuculose-1-phosphate aldolase
MTSADAAKELVKFGRYLNQHGLAPGGSGNLSLKIDDGFLATPTGSRLVFLEAASLARLNSQGLHVAGDKPSKEIQVHLAFYRSHPECRAVVHLHAPHAMALSCLDGLDPEAPLPPLTPYFVMRVGRLGLLPYLAPGTEALAAAVEETACYDALLLRNHGLLIGGKNLDDAVANAEELEETAKIFLALPDNRRQSLNSEQIAQLEHAYHHKES